MRNLTVFWTACAVLLNVGAACGDTPLSEKIDHFIESTAGPNLGTVADDQELVRRLFLDFAGRIPSIAEAQAFLADSSKDKHIALIDRLLDAPDYIHRMRDVWNVELMERAGEHEEWTKYLEASFAANKPWDVMVREILNPNPDDESTRGAAFFLTKRLENYGQQPVDIPGLTRDVGRLFLGIDLQCAQCHDHLFIDDYKQVDFQGLHAFVSHLAIRSDVKFPAVTERVVDKKAEFMSVFVKQAKTTGPRLPFGNEIEVQVFAKGEEFAVAPDRKSNSPGKPKFSPLTILSEQLPRPSNPFFVRNIVNRLWRQMMGRGLIHPLDLHHQGNPPSHPEVMNLLASNFVEHRFDIKWLLRELALTRTYRRTSLVPDGIALEPSPESYVVAIEKPLSTEQLLRSILQATESMSKYQPVSQADGSRKPNLLFDELKKRFIAAFANPPRDPEGDFTPSVKAALFLSNDGRVFDLLKPDAGNLTEQLLKEDNSSRLVETLFMAVLTRSPSPEELQAVSQRLAAHPDHRDILIGQMIWALICSTEFCVNH